MNVETDYLIYVQFSDISAQSAEPLHTKARSIPFASRSSHRVELEATVPRSKGPRARGDKA